MTQMLPGAEALSLLSLVTPTEHGIASRVLGKTSGGNVTLFAIDAGQALTELRRRSMPFEIAGGVRAALVRFLAPAGGRAFALREL
jgi:hypothetical protein